MIDQPVIVLPSLSGGQAESWAALVELAPAFGQNWLLVGGQMVFLHELERQSIDVLAPDNVGRRVQLTLGSGRTIEAPGTSQAFHRCGVVRVEAGGASAQIRRPDLVGALLGKAAAVVKISSQSAASRAKHLRDFDSLARLLGANDRANADLSKRESNLLGKLADSPELSRQASASLGLMLGAGL